MMKWIASKYGRGIVTNVHKLPRVARRALVKQFRKECE
jgi:hypothetical protein